VGGYSSSIVRVLQNRNSRCFGFYPIDMAACRNYCIRSHSRLITGSKNVDRFIMFLVAAFGLVDNIIMAIVTGLHFLLIILQKMSTIIILTTTTLAMTKKIIPNLLQNHPCIEIWKTENQ
ncbi:hypothetical protein RYX36_001725, partial [Vicia faba]